MRQRGSIRPTSDPKKWRIVASVKGDDGQRKRIWRTVEGTQSAAQKALNNLLTEAEKGTVTGTSMKLRDWLHMWLDSAAGDIKPSTLRSYRQHVRDHINPAIGKISLDKLRPHHIEQVKAEVQKSCSPTTAHRVYATIHRALTIAERRELVARNVARNVEPPKQRVRRQRIDLEAVETVLARIEQPTLSRLYRVAYATGLRRGELQGMTWRAVDLDRGVIKVEQTLTREPGKGLVVGTPKSDTSNRSIHLDAGTIGILREQLIAQEAAQAAYADVYTNNGMVWTDDLGLPFSPERVTKTFHRAAVAAGFPELHLHSLRHAHGTALAEVKAHPRTIQQRLGHSSAAFTMNVYVSDSDALDMEAANLFGQRFGRNRVEKSPVGDSPEPVSEPV